jgi:diacylglycerol kinase (ATP)
VVGVRRALVIVNDQARGDVGVRPEVEALLAAAGGWDTSTVVTEMRGHGVLLAEEAAAKGVELVLSVGGDGTAREVAAGLAGTDSALGIIPAGTGNSSYRALFGDTRWQVWLGSALAMGDLGARRVDLLQVEPTGELSLLGFSIGWFAEIIDLAAADRTTPGPDKYATAAMKVAQAPGRFSAHVALDGTTLADGELGLLAVGGSPVRGSVFPVLPRSRMDDGLLDVMTVAAVESAGFSEMLDLVMNGTHLDDDRVHWGQGQTVSVRAGSTLPAEIDGDPWDRHLGETTMSVAPGALVVVPAL